MSNRFNLGFICIKTEQLFSEKAREIMKKYKRIKIIISDYLIVSLNTFKKISFLLIELNNKISTDFLKFEFWKL